MFQVSDDLREKAERLWLSLNVRNLKSDDRSTIFPNKKFLIKVQDDCNLLTPLLALPVDCIPRSSWKTYCNGFHERTLESSGS